MINYLIGGILIAAMILSIWKIRKDKKNGSCCGSCSGCSSAKHCQSYQDLKKN